MKHYVFTVTLSGVGETAAEAWIDAVDQFADDPGEPETTTLDHDDNEMGRSE